jgi:hypothetical protein
MFVLLLATGCASSSDYNQAASQLGGYALNCAMFSCPDSPRTFVILQGRVLAPGRPGMSPLAHVRVVLRRDGEAVASASTDHSGRFQFTQDIDDGFYALVLDSRDHEGTVPVVLEGRPRTVDLHVLPTPPGPPRASFRR